MKRKLQDRTHTQLPRAKFAPLQVMIPAEYGKMKYKYEHYHNFRRTELTYNYKEHI